MLCAFVSIANAQPNFTSSTLTHITSEHFQIARIGQDSTVTGYRIHNGSHDIYQRDPSGAISQFPLHQLYDYGFAGAVNDANELFAHGFPLGGILLSPRTTFGCSDFADVSTCIIPEGQLASSLTMYASNNTGVSVGRMIGLNGIVAGVVHYAGTLYNVKDFNLSSQITNLSDVNDSYLAISQPNLLLDLASAQLSTITVVGSNVSLSEIPDSRVVGTLSDQTTNVSSAAYWNISPTSAHTLLPNHRNANTPYYSTSQINNQKLIGGTAEFLTGPILNNNYVNTALDILWFPKGPNSYHLPVRVDSLASFPAGCEPEIVYIANADLTASSQQYKLLVRCNRYAMIDDLYLLELQ